MYSPPDLNRFFCERKVFSKAMKKLPFIGRIDELKRLERLTKKRSSSLVVIHGRRRIGKSRLIEEFGKKYRFLRFSGLPPVETTTQQTQREEFARNLSKKLKISVEQKNDWGDLFSILAEATKQGRVIIVLDEISWMGSKDPYFLGKLKNAWDLEFKQNPELILILCGSVSSWIEENILSSTGFMGRLSLTLFLQELKLIECNQLLDELGFRGSEYDKFKILSITGGIPRYLEEVDPDLPAEANIQELCFKPSGILFHEFDDIFSDLFGKKSDIYKKIVTSLIGNPKELNEVLKEVPLSSDSHLNEYLQNLMRLGFIRRDYSWALKTGRESQLSRFRLSDNYLRFYLKYIEPNQAKITNDHFSYTPVSTLPAWDSIMGLQFENLVIASRELIWGQLPFSPADIVNDNPFFQRKTTRVKGCQVDYMIQTRFNNLFICEIKFSRNILGPHVIEEMKEKIARISLPRGFSCWPVLIHVNGVSDAILESNYFSQIIAFSTLLKATETSPTARQGAIVENETAADLALATQSLTPAP